MLRSLRRKRRDEIRCKTARYNDSFFPDATSSWNNMISNFQDIPTFTSLKSHLLSLTRRKIKSIFGIHDALGLRYLFQMCYVLYWDSRLFPKLGNILFSLFYHFVRYIPNLPDFIMGMWVPSRILRTDGCIMVVRRVKHSLTIEVNSFDGRSRH